jgi:hypothetical protein
MKDFEHTMERRDGGLMTISVKADSLTLTVPPPVTTNEKEAMAGLKSLADALKRDANGSDVQAKDGVVSLKINTPNGPDNPLAMVAASSLETHDVLKPGESKKFETALHAFEKTAQAKAAEPISKEISEVQKAAAAIGAALKGVISPADPVVAAAAGQNLPGKSESRTLG